MEEISFKATPAERVLIDKIVTRAANYVENHMGGYRPLDGKSLEMDLTAVNANDCALDFSKLLEFDDFNFMHDVFGIIGNLDRTTGKLKNCFLPRSAKPQIA